MHEVSTQRTLCFLLDEISSHHLRSDVYNITYNGQSLNQQLSHTIGQLQLALYAYYFVSFKMKYEK